MPVAGKRLLFATLGLLATGIAILGVWLPGVPTVFPLIVALWAFGKSSARLQRWVEQLPLLKHVLVEAQRFDRDRTISRRVKFVAQLSAWLSVAFVGLLTQSIGLTLAVASGAVACSIVMALVPTAPRDTMENLTNSHNV